MQRSMSAGIGMLSEIKWVLKSRGMRISHHEKLMKNSRICYVGREVKDNTTGCICSRTSARNWYNSVLLVRGGGIAYLQARRA